MANIFYFTILTMLSWVCKSNQVENSIAEINSKNNIIVFTDSMQASIDIIQDDIDGFFDQISALDIRIQMKKTESFDAAETALDAYQKYLAKEVSDWTPTEKNYLMSLFVSAKSLLDAISPDIFPEGIKLIKIKTNHYGKDVYYTRGKNILIPENIFTDFDPDIHLPVMLHEIFHIYSRYRPYQRDKLYGLIGFSKAKAEIKLPQIFAERLLTNPDGIAMNYYITLSSEAGDSVKAIPLLSSKFENYADHTSSFLNYLQFDLYALDTTKADVWSIFLKDKISSTIALNKTPSFFTKIKDNTQYIIHPDEIMADNFMLAALANESQDFKKFSPDGKRLIDEVIQILKTK